MEFHNVTIVKKANSYFDGAVTSRTVKFADGTHKTLGIMQKGNYTFGTDAKEIMEILAGKCEVKLPGAAAFETYEAGSTFEVPAKSSFDIRVLELTDYCCSYLN